MKRFLAVAVLAAIVSSSSVAQWTAPTTGLSNKIDVSTSKTDADNCPLITVTHTGKKKDGDKPYRLTVRYTHSGTTIGNAPSSESNSFTELNFQPEQSKDIQINPGANCRKPNRLRIDDVKAELY